MKKRLLNADQPLGHLRFFEQIQPSHLLPRSSDLAVVGSGGPVLGGSEGQSWGQSLFVQRRLPIEHDSERRRRAVASRRGEEKSFAVSCHSPVHLGSRYLEQDFRWGDFHTAIGAEGN